MCSINLKLFRCSRARLQATHIELLSSELRVVAPMMLESTNIQIKASASTYLSRGAGVRQSERRKKTSDALTISLDSERTSRVV
jgi:hypothetical protein